MKVWTNNCFTGHYPVGTAAVVVAEDATDAAELLNQSLRDMGLPGDAEAGEMVEITIAEDTTSVTILCDGNY